VRRSCLPEKSASGAGRSGALAVSELSLAPAVPAGDSAPRRQTCCLVGGATCHHDCGSGSFQSVLQKWSMLGNPSSSWLRNRCDGGIERAAPVAAGRGLGRTTAHDHRPHLLELPGFIPGEAWSREPCASGAARRAWMHASRPAQCERPANSAIRRQVSSGASSAQKCPAPGTIDETRCSTPTRRNPSR